MSIHRARRSRRNVPRHPLLFFLGFAVLLLAPVFDTIGNAQVLPVQAQPTATPTEVVDPSLQARPTPTPTPRVTEEPEEPDEITDDVQANPTALPVTETVVDDIAPNPEPATLTLTKGVCDDSGFDPYAETGLDTFQAACFSPDGEFEFTVANGAGFSETASTSLGSVLFTVPAGTIVITETIPDGFGEPAVFCWSSLFPSPAAQPFLGNGPSWNVAEGEQIECWWFNVSEPEPPGHTIRVTKQVCPDGFAIPDDYWTIANGCTDRLDGIGFALTTDSGTVDGLTDANGEIEWTGVDLGTSGQVQLDEDIPDGYGEPVVWCVNFPQEAADAQDFDFFEVAATDGLAAVTPEQHEPYIFSCTFFNMAGDGAPGDLTTDNLQEGGAGNTVTVITRRCPMGVVEDAGFDDYQAICTQEHDDIAFTLDHAGGSFPGTTAGGLVQWTDVPPGDFAIEETVPAGFLDPLVWCGFNPSIQLPGLMPSAGGLVTGSFGNGGSEYVCYWFNIQDPDANNSISINTYACPAGVPYVNDDDFYKANCPESHPGVEFALSAPHGVFPDTTDGDGMVAWTAVPLGESSVQETIPEGFGEPVVICNFATTVPHGLPFEDGPLSRIQSPSGLVSAPIDEPNVDYRCSWFNIPDSGPESRVLIDKRICADDVDLVLTDDNVINDIITACPETGDGFEFTLDHAEGSSTQAIVDGATWWDGVPNGPITVTEEIPAGYGEPVWYCSTNPIDESGDVLPSGVWALGNAPGGVLDDSLDEPYGEVFHCWVFNVPVEDEENSVTILKWRCPEGSGSDEDQAWYEANCVEEHDGVEFRVASDIGIAVMETAGGGVQFDGLPAGAVSSQETIPEGFEAPAVFCATDAGWDAYPAPTGHWQYEFAADGLDQALACHVYNIPGQPGSVTVLKWTCPAGYDLFADGADPKVDCAEATNGIEFQFGLASVEAEAALQATGDLIDGGVIFDDLEPDTYKAVELVPEGIGQVFVLECTGHIMGVLQPYPLQMGNVLEIDLDAGEHLVCHWYNVPEPGGGTIIVTKYTCTTETFVSEVECEIEEDGQAFDLLHWNVGEGVWEVIDTEVTDGVGVIAWIELEAGDYGLDEHDGEWCHLTTLPVFGEGDSFYVYENEETIVSVYNCDGEPGKPGDTPEKYPNTGVPPGARDDNRFQP
ncbi:MAG: hypothetical protein H0V37_09325 [Chloroflexia bacterium]|nr:hypothetical protein [Chloroflexia bacterium]